MPISSTSERPIEYTRIANCYMRHLNNHKKYFEHEKVSPREGLSLYIYTNSGFRIINNYLRGQFNRSVKFMEDNFRVDYLRSPNEIERETTLKSECEIIVNELKNALKKIKPVTDKVLYRATTLSHESIQKIEKEGVFADAGFLSTSLTKSVAKNFFSGIDSSNSKVQIKIIKSLTGRPIKNLSVFPEEDEVLFAPNTRFKVISVTKKEGLPFKIKLEEIA